LGEDSPRQAATGRGEGMTLNVAILLSPGNFDHPVDDIQLLETHISWVILTGNYVYKIKKPVNFGFLDFSSLDQRKHFCEEELRLNRRLAADIYLDVVPIYGSPAEPHFTAEGEIIDYAVKMRQFPQEAQLDRLLQAKAFTSKHLDAIADAVADFHMTIEKADAQSPYGEPERVWQPVEENFAQIRERESDTAILQQLQTLADWSRSSFEHLRPVLSQRKQDGFVRECHGDLHLRNIAWFEDHPVIFDCIEFNPNLRWVDVISDLAFLFMDLIDRGQAAMAYRMLDRYLSRTGDYSGVAVLPFYVVYRAMVRAKVDRIRLSQPDITATEHEQGLKEFAGYIQLANSFVHRATPVLILTWGLSGSGKTTVTDKLIPALGAIRLRSDVERKRLAGLDAMTRAGSGVDSGIYTPEMSECTYTYLLQQARSILAAGFAVIVDAAFLDAARRAPFAKLAEQMHLPFVILQCEASEVCLRERIRARQHDASDADLAVLEHQLHELTPITGNEMAHVIHVNTELDTDVTALINQIMGHAQEVVHV